MERGLTVAEVCDEVGGSIDDLELLEIETGRRSITDEDLVALADLYGLKTSSMIPGRSRLVIDLDEGVIDADGATADLSDAAQRRDVLSRYLALVYTMRGKEPGTTITLRIADLDVLAEALGCDRRSVEDELVSLMVATPEPVRKRFRLLRGRTVVPVVGVLVASTTAGALVLTDAKDSAAAEPQRPVAEQSVREVGVANPTVVIDDAAFQDRNADGTPGVVQVRLGDDANPGATG